MSSRRAQPTRRRSRPSRSTWLTLAFGATAVLAIVLLGVATVSGPLADARHPVVTVNGRTLDRTALRGRLTLDAELHAAREAVLRTATTADLVSAEDRATIGARTEAAAADPLRSAIDGLVRDTLIRDAVAAAGLSLDVDIDAELAEATVADFDRPIRFVTVAHPYGEPTPPAGDWPAPALPASGRAAMAAAQGRAVNLARTALQSGTPVADVVSGLRAAGWRTDGGDRWLPTDGPVPGLPDPVVATARRMDASNGALAVDDPISGVSGIVQVLPTTLPSGATSGLVDRSLIDGTALRDWAAARAGERALREHMAATWASEPMERVRVAELVVGPADLEGAPGPYRSFAHVVVAQLASPHRLSGETDDALAARLATELEALSNDGRLTRFAELIEAANQAPRSDPLTESGEIGYFTSDQLLPALATAAFGDSVEVGDVLGPITTIVGPELFLVRGRFDGVLDERTNAALVEARSAPDLAVLADRISPTGKSARADGSLWRAVAETIGAPTIKQAFNDTTIGGRSEPIILGEEIVIVSPLERQIGRLGGPELDRLSVRGFDTWLDGAIAAAIIVRDAEPLPGVVVASPTPAGSAASVPPGSPPPTAPAASLPAPSEFAIPTPQVIP